MARRMRESADVDRDFYTSISALDRENKRTRAREKGIEKALGVPFKRRPICGGRKAKIILGNVCAHCGKDMPCDI